VNIFDSLLEFLELGAVARAMRDSLAYRLVAPEVHLPEQEQAAINHALSHLGKVREGFVISQRASDTPRMSELRDLVKAILLEWRRAEELFGVQLMPSNEVELPRTQLLAFAHSYVTFAMIPQLPPDQVTFPQARRTYADIPAPHTPGEVLERIEEMEELVTAVESAPLERVSRGRLRRTYGFFETSAWLVSSHAAKFGARP